MAENLWDILDELTPELDRALTGRGLDVDLGGAVYRVRQARAEAPAGPPPAKVVRRQAEEVLVGFEEPRRTPPVERPTPAEPRRRPEHVKVLSFSREESTRERPPPPADIAEDRLFEALTMAPSEGATVEVLAAWFQLDPRALRPRLDELVELGSLVRREKRYRKASPEGSRPPETAGSASETDGR